MQSEIRRRSAIAAFLMFVFVAIASLGVARGVPKGASHPANGEVERGKYLVENVAMCGECHTPRDSAGNVKTASLLQGAPIWITPVAHIQQWADHAPAIAGLPGFTDQQALTVLEKGTGPNGEVLRPPMHIYHMKDPEARAIIAYLKSLPEEKH
jgi:mono/diheme cytochrome c family protein